MNNQINHNPANDPDTPFRPAGSARLSEDTEGHRRGTERRTADTGSGGSVEMPPVDADEDTEGHRR
jgi:hypothetical protein